MKFHSLSAILLLATLPCVAQKVVPPHLAGYITRIASPQDFDINGQSIQLSATTTISIQQPPSPSQPHQTYAPLPLSGLHPYFGEPVELFGQQDIKQHSIQADRLILNIRAPHSVSGSAIVDAVLAPPATASSPADHLIRADGYLILISSATVSTFKKPLSSPSDIQVNRWVHFQGNQREDGIVVAEKAQFTENVVHPDDLRHQTECDPPAVPEDTPPGVDAEPACDIYLPQILASTDSAMQARINAIGSKLIPTYQLALPSTDTIRINFRFRVIADNKDTAKWHDALTLPDGIILIPHAAVQRLENDSQIAAVLADNIASALEKQPLMTEKKAGDMTADYLLFGAGGLVFDMLDNHSFHSSEDQRGRVSLWLMHDAGYDIYQAPIAWWLLASKKPQPLADTPLPRRAASLYQFLGESWPPQESSAPASSSVASSTPASAPAAP